MGVCDYSGVKEDLVSAELSFSKLQNSMCNSVVIKKPL